MKIRIAVALTVPFVVLLLATAAAVWAVGTVFSQRTVDDVLDLQQRDAVKRVRDEVDAGVLRTAKFMNVFADLEFREPFADFDDLRGDTAKLIWTRLRALAPLLHSSALSGFWIGTYDGRRGPSPRLCTLPPLFLSAAPEQTDDAVLEYEIEADGVPRGSPVRVNRNYDPKDRSWFTPGADSFGWSAPYILTSNDFGISACQPLVNSKGEKLGVMATTFLVEGLESFLKSMPYAELGAVSFIVERGTGLLVAASRGPSSPATVDGRFTPDRRLAPSDPIVDATIREAAARLLDEYGSFASATLNILSSRRWLGEGTLIQAADLTSLALTWYAFVSPRRRPRLTLAPRPQVVCTAVPRGSFTPRSAWTFAVSAAIAVAVTVSAAPPARPAPPGPNPAQLVGLLAGVAVSHVVTRRLSRLSARMERMRSADLGAGFAEAVRPGASQRVPPSGASVGEAKGRRRGRPPRLVAALRRAWQRALGGVRALQLKELAEIESIFYDSIVLGLAHHYQEARSLNNLRSEFVRNMSHEIRTRSTSAPAPRPAPPRPPRARLTGRAAGQGIVGCAALLRDTGLTAEQLEFAELIAKAGESLVEIISNILDWEKVQSGKLVLEETEFELRRCLEDSADLLVMAAQQQGVELLTRLSPEVPARIAGDPVRLRQVLINLTSNAIKFSRGGGTVLVEVRLVRGHGRRPASDSSTEFASSPPSLRSRSQRIGALSPSFRRLLAPPPSRVAPGDSPAGSTESQLRSAAYAPPRSPPSLSPPPAPAPAVVHIGREKANDGSCESAGVSHYSFSGCALDLPEPPPAPLHTRAPAPAPRPSEHRSRALGPRPSAVLPSAPGEDEGVAWLEFSVSDEGIAEAGRRHHHPPLRRHWRAPGPARPPRPAGSASEGRGTGLGLALSAAIVNELGGSIEVESAPTGAPGAPTTRPARPRRPRPRLTRARARSRGGRFHFAIPLRVADWGADEAAEEAARRRRRRAAPRRCASPWWAPGARAVGGGGSAGGVRAAAAAAAGPRAVPSFEEADGELGDAPGAGRTVAVLSLGAARAAGLLGLAALPPAPHRRGAVPLVVPSLTTPVRVAEAEALLFRLDALDALGPARPGPAPAPAGLEIEAPAAPSPGARASPHGHPRTPSRLASLPLPSAAPVASLESPRTHIDRGVQRPSRKPPRPGRMEEANILCAEDNAFNCLVLTKLLARTGCRFRVVHDGRQAVDALLQHQRSDPFHLCLMARPAPRARPRGRA
eukprot:tig00000492_g1570.t1